MTVSSDILKHIFNLKPEKAAEYLKQKGMKTSGAWWQVYEKEHARVFTVAQTSAVKAGYDVLKDIRAAVQKAIDEGTTLRDFQKELKPLLKQKGWWGRIPDPKNPEREIQLGSVRRLEKIFDINVRTAYQTGRYNDLAENAQYRPYWQYIAVMDDRTRKEHKSLHGKVFRWDDPFWDTFFPPNGWNCRCTVKSLSERELKQRGLTVENTDGRLISATATLPNGQKVSGKVYRNGGKIVQTDVGWNYNPGKAAYQPMDDGKDPALRAEMDKILKNKTDSFLNEEEKNEAENNISKSMKNYMNEYGSETQGGFTSIKILKNMQYRSGTTCNGIYYLSEEVAKQFNSALLKIPKGEPLSLSEEESGKTQWHEIYHNRAEFPLPSNATPNQINAMELLNEFVSRRTYNIFWQRFNYPVQYQKTIIEYAETGYQPQQEKFNKFMRDYDLDTPENLVELEEILIKKPQVEIAANLRNWLIQKTKIEGETAVQAKLRKESIKKELKRIIKNID